MATEQVTGTLRALRGRHAGRRGFIIGNGPSLRAEDLDRLQQAGEITLACNKIFLIFGKTEWRPTYFVIEDQGVAASSSREIEEHFKANVVYADYLEEKIAPASRGARFRLRDRVSPPCLPGFSRDLSTGIVCGGTVTYSMLQLAYWLGLSEVILLGVDFSYSLPGLRPSAEFAGFQTYTPDSARNYFTADYLKDGEVHVAPDLASSQCAFVSARKFMDRESGFRILNATRGGKLDLFPRVEFDEVAARPHGEDEELARKVREMRFPNAQQRAQQEAGAAWPRAGAPAAVAWSLVDELSRSRVESGGEFGRASEGTVRIEDDESRTLFLHPPVRVIFNLPTGSAGRLALAMGMHPDVWGNPDCGPCRFIVKVDGTVLSDVTLDVCARPADRGWHSRVIEIPEALEGTHQIELETKGVGGIAFRWALWRAPVFVWEREKDSAS